MPLFYHKTVNYVSSHSVNYDTTLYSFASRPRLPCTRIHTGQGQWACVCERACFRVTTRSCLQLLTPPTKVLGLSVQTGLFFRTVEDACPYKACAEIVVVAIWGSFGENRRMNHGLVCANGLVFPDSPVACDLTPVPTRLVQKSWSLPLGDRLAKIGAPTTGCRHTP